MDPIKELARTEEKGSVSEVRLMILEQGPIRSSDLPRSVSQIDRENGIRKFKLHNSHKGSSLSIGKQEPVYYHDEYHDCEAVIQAWAVANEHAVESVTNWSLHHRISSKGEEWKAASRDVFGPFEAMQESGGEANMGGTCDLCGDDYDRYLRDHLPCDG